jgi:hypothetical protein
MGSHCRDPRPGLVIQTSCNSTSLQGPPITTHTRTALDSFGRIIHDVEIRAWVESHIYIKA